MLALDNNITFFVLSYLFSISIWYLIKKFNVIYISNLRGVYQVSSSLEKIYGA